MITTISIHDIMMMMTTETTIPTVTGINVELEDDEPWLLMAVVCITIRIGLL